MVNTKMRAGRYLYHDSPFPGWAQGSRDRYQGSPLARLAHNSIHLVLPRLPHSHCPDPRMERLPQCPLFHVPSRVTTPLPFLSTQGAWNTEDFLTDYFGIGNDLH